MKYYVVIHKDPSSSYGVTVPDLPGCFSGGDTFEEALSSVREAIQGHIEVLLMEGDVHTRKDSPCSSTRPMMILLAGNGLAYP